jgi:hypothetical protein
MSIDLTDYHIGNGLMFVWLVNTTRIKRNRRKMRNEIRRR